MHKWNYFENIRPIFRDSHLINVLGNGFFLSGMTLKPPDHDMFHADGPSNQMQMSLPESE